MQLKKQKRLLRKQLKRQKQLKQHRKLKILRHLSNFRFLIVKNKNRSHKNIYFEYS